MKTNNGVAYLAIFLSSITSDQLDDIYKIGVNCSFNEVVERCINAYEKATGIESESKYYKG